MAERRMGIIAFLFCLCLCLMPCCAQAASTQDAAEAIVPENECSLVLSYRFDGAAVSDVPVKIYKIADVSADFQYGLTSPFAASGLVLNGVQSASEWNIIRSTLEAHILADGIDATAVVLTDQAGCARFEALRPGLYLVEAVNEVNCAFDSTLIALPGLGSDGRWQYDVAASPKPEGIPPVEPDDPEPAEKEFRILKLWKGDEGRNNRPESIKVEIYRNGTVYETVILSEENHWAYAWTAPDDGTDWMVMERDVPAGYTVTVEERAASFVLTNTLIPENPPAEDETEPETSPKTGDTSNIMLYTVLMYGSGIILILLGISGKRKRT